MHPDTTFCVNEPGVIAEVIEGEAIILDFASGTYYSLNASFQYLWEGLVRGLSLSRLQILMRARYPGAGDGLEEQVRSAVGQLLVENLVVASQRSPAIASAVEAIATAPDYQPPRLHKYTDLQELLLLDPIHDIDAAGQPLTRG